MTPGNLEQEELAVRMAAHSYEAAVRQLATSTGSLRARIADAYANKASVSHDLLFILPADIAADMERLRAMVNLTVSRAPAWGGGISEEDVAAALGRCGNPELHDIADLMCTIAAKLLRADARLDAIVQEQSRNER